MRRMTRRAKRLRALGIGCAWLGSSAAADLSAPLASNDLVFEERGGLVAAEAEHFTRQEKIETRGFYRTSADENPGLKPDPDPSHVAGASGGAYLEILPDTRRTHRDELIGGENFVNEPGKMAMLSYPVYFNTPGRYYVWARIHSTGTEDNGLHVGIDGAWPPSGQRMQWTAKDQWKWNSKQRTEAQHGGERHKLYLDLETPGLHTIQFSMREDGLEFDKWLMTTDRDFVEPADTGPAARVRSGHLPAAYPTVPIPPAATSPTAALPTMPAVQFPIEDSGFYVDNRWLAINPSQHQTAAAIQPFPFQDGRYDVVLYTVGENDGQSRYRVSVDGRELGSFKNPPSTEMYEEGPAFRTVWPAVGLIRGDAIQVESMIAGADGTEHSRGRWVGLAFAPAGKGASAPGALPLEAAAATPVAAVATPKVKRPETPARKPGQDGSGEVRIAGELKSWHKITLELDGPYAHELDASPNPFTDLRMTAHFRHESGEPSYRVPGYFAADGDAGNSSAAQGTVWRAHLSPDKPGQWSYRIAFHAGPGVAVSPATAGSETVPYHGVTGSFQIAPSDKEGRDFRGKGRLQYVGKHHLRFAGSGQYFLKAGPDAPETMLGYADFDGTYSTKPSIPIKTWEPHLRDWRSGDPTWAGGKGKGLIGAMNYLSGKGCNAVSFLTYNAGGDGQNVWPFVYHDDPLHYDCSKLDQWQTVFDHAQSLGLYLHFKTQEQENDDDRLSENPPGTVVDAALDGGDLGTERTLYYRELIARFGYALALNWNLGEENTQSPEQQRACAQYFHDTDPYHHNLVVHTFPDAQDKVYPELLGEQSTLSGASLQNQWDQTHQRTLEWVAASAAAGRPWVVANDEQGSASSGVPPDPGYPGFKTEAIDYDLHDVRAKTLWGNLMAGGAGVEYYFGYKLPENDLICEDYRSRDRSWDYARIAIACFRENDIPFWDMTCRDDLLSVDGAADSAYCLARAGEVYVVYLSPTTGTTLDLSADAGQPFRVAWYNPRAGGALAPGSVRKVTGGDTVRLGAPPADPDEDWVVVVRAR